MGNVYTVPYLEMYRNVIGNAFDIIYWNRENKKEQIKCNSVFEFKYDINNKSVITKIIGFIKYRQYIKKILRNKKYDRVVLLQTWVALLLFGFINTLYKHKFIVDIRDYTYENNKIIKAIEKIVLKNARMRLISSEGFKQFLPSNLKYHVIHNVRNLPDKERYEIINRSHNSHPIRIAYIGFVNYIDANLQLIQALGNDERFHLSFIGTNALKLKDYCDKNKITNVTLIDTFKPEEILKFYKETDIINNLYGHNDPRLDYALSNKLYFATQLEMPILVFSNTYMAEVSRKYGIGIEIEEIDNHLANRIYSKYKSIKWERMNTGCNKLLNKIIKEQSDTLDYLKRVLS
jgi:hypothetical protein